jgi:EmrB/QacA subfamily drug resistance transporter
VFNLGEIMTHPRTSHDEPLVMLDSGKRPNGALFVLALVQAMLVIDVTVVNVALPLLGTELGLTGSLAGWAIAAYSVPFGGLLLLGGRLADMFGARRMLLVGLVVFGAASLLAGLAIDPVSFLAARGAQGVAAAMLSPAALATLVTTFQGAARHRALAVWGAVGGAGAAVGVLLGGLLAGGPGWRWIFFVNVPVAIVVAIALPFVVAVVQRGDRQKLDVVGALLATLGFASVVAAISVASTLGSGITLALGLIGLALLVAFVLVERRTAQPLIRPGLLRTRAVASGVVLIFSATVLLVGGLFLLSYLLQSGEGWTAVQTGLAMLPVAVAVVVGAHLAGRLVGIVGPRRVAGVSLTVTIAGMIGAALAAGTPDLGAAAVYWTIAGVAIAALGLGAAFVCASTTGLSRVAPEEAGSASGALNSFHELGAGVGVAVMAATLSQGFGFAFFVLAAVALVAGPLSVALLPKGVPATGGASFMH